MLFNIRGPGEGKSYANNVLNCQFKQALDKESNVIPNTFKNLLDTSVLESDVVSRDVNTGKVDTVKYHAVHNCGFVWNTNTLGFVSDAWADRCVIMESEFPTHVTRTRSSKQLQDTVEKQKMGRVTAMCLYRQNLVQSATMIAESEIMQFDRRFDAARDACVAPLYSSHIVCTGAASRQVSFCINQLVFAEAMKLACHFVFDFLTSVSSRSLTGPRLPYSLARPNPETRKHPSCSGDPRWMGLLMVCLSEWQRRPAVSDTVAAGSLDALLIRN
ncbi:hypothetical protein F2P81_018427 [Scophthalmus maximus]|uniref:Uncharacterized protein n=1 Tax=Scophthalmus maximus TaxID=52904 RepID=A0A6A4SG29_SCOMX|nr:hypothetical protein F2P81_018427 [Scophthalmus maximus]